MTTAARIEANRANAQLSTGPKTEEGKARSSQNNFKSGLTSREFVILSGQEDFFREWMISLHAAVLPFGAIEFDVFRQLAHASWTLHRCRQAEVQSFHNQRHKGYDILAYPVNEDTMKLIDLYTRRAESSYQKALMELKTLQTERLLRDASHPASAPLADPRIVNQHKQSAAAEKSVTVCAGQTRAAETAATAGDSEKSNPIQSGDGDAPSNASSESLPSTPPIRTEAAAAGSGISENSKPIQPGHSANASDLTPESRTARLPLRMEPAAIGSAASEKSNPIPGGSSVTAAAPPAR